MPYVSDEVVVKLKPGVSLDALQPYALAYDIHEEAALAALGVTILKVPEGRVIEIASALNRSPLVEFAEPNHFVRAADTIPNDPGWVSQYGPVNIQAPQAWDIVTGSISVTIAVIDTGVDLTHPDLAAKIWTNPGEIPGNGVDDDLNGYVDDWRGWDFVNHDNEPQDDHGHGTHVAGIAAAASDNGAGIAGISWGARIMPLKVLDSGGNGTDSDLAAALVFAADHGARVINLSLGGGAASVMESAVNYAHSRGAIVIAAAGNSSGQGVLYPAAYAKAMAVAATDAGNHRASFSSYGPEVDIAAPGIGIYSTHWTPGSGGTYAYLSGTSMATPHVAGAAALLASLPQFDTPDRLRLALESTALDLGPICRDVYYGAGVVQAYAALQYEPDASPPMGCYYMHFPFFIHNSQP